MLLSGLLAACGPASADSKKKPAAPAPPPAATATATAAPTVVYPDMSSCIQKEDHQAITYVLIDRTDKLQDVEHLKQTLHTIHDMIQPGERLIIGVSTSRLSETRVLMDLARPVSSIWDSTLKIRAREKKFADCFAKVSDIAINQNESHPSSAILETLSYTASVLKADSSASKRLILFSDMIQNSDSISFYKMKEVDADAALKKAAQEKLIYHFAGVLVSVAGAGTGVDEHKARSIEQFWRKYFESSGGALKIYGPLLLSQ
jgi:hypothetical protein